MKKLLLASSALVLVGGTAFAEITLGGYAEMGFVGGEANNNIPDGAEFDTDAQFWSDMDVDFTLSGETDGGVVFGTHIDLDDATKKSIPETTDGDFSVFVSGDFGTVTLGDTDGAFDWALQDTSFGLSGSINDNEEHLGYDGMSLLDGFYDGQIARYDYSFGDFAFAVSAEIDDDADSDSDTREVKTTKDTDTTIGGVAGTVPFTTTETVTGEDHDDPMLGVGATYNLALSGGTVALGAAYQGNDGDNYIAGLSAAATFGALQGGIAYYDGEVAGLSLGANDDNTNLELKAGDENSTESLDISYVGGSIAYTFDAITVGVNAGTYDIENVDTAFGWGINAGYDLGGGLKLLAGYGYSEAKTDNGVPADDAVDFDANTYSFGLKMSF